MAARTLTGFPPFFYRINPNQTIDAICPHCYLTAATASNQDELHQLVRGHSCPV